MSAAEFHPASPINPRRRATREEMRQRADFLVDYAAAHGPVTVRQLYYQAEIVALPGIDKTESSYDKVQRQVLLLRRAGGLAYRHVADLTRWMRKPATFDSVEAALQETARLYRKSLWRDAEAYVEVWCEKDAVAGVICPVTALYDVPLTVARGFSSETFCFEAVKARVGDNRPYVIYYLGDFDRAGQDAAAELREKLERFAGERSVAVAFTHLAIEESDIVQFDGVPGQVRVALKIGDNEFDRWLPTREPKRKSRNDQLWPHPFGYELDAIAPDDLRNLVRGAIEAHLPADQLTVLQVAETSERTLIAHLVGAIGGAQ
jgi:hypothetical protein